MKTTHTPGPWNVNIPPHKFPIYAAHPANRFAYVATTPRDDGLTDAERDANARLIAAAPELLEALRLALVTIECLAPSHRGFDSTRSSKDVICAAISKASDLT